MQIMIKERCGVALPNSPPLKKIFERLLESYPNTMGSSYTSLSLSGKEKDHTTTRLVVQSVYYSIWTEASSHSSSTDVRTSPFGSKKRFFEYKVWTFRVRLKKRKKKTKKRKKNSKKMHHIFFIIFSHQQRHF